MHLHKPGIGLARPARVLADPFLNDPGAKPFGGAAVRRGQQCIFRMGTEHKKPTRPFLPYEILSNRIRQHAVRRRDVNKIGPTILLTE